MLGVGPDGHVASLFPGSPQLDVDDQIAVGVTDSPKPPPERIIAHLRRPQPQPVGLVPGQRRGEGRRRRPAPSPRAPTSHDIPAAGVTGERGDHLVPRPRPAAVAAASGQSQARAGQKTMSPALRRERSRLSASSRMSLRLGVGAALLHVGQVRLVGLDPGAGGGLSESRLAGQPARGSPRSRAPAASIAKVTTERCSCEQK